MLNRSIRATFEFAHLKTGRTANWVALVRKTASGFAATAQRALMIVGVSAIATLCVMFVKPEIADELKNLSPFSEDSAQESDAEAPQLTGLLEVPPSSTTDTAARAVPLASGTKADNHTRQQQWVTNWLSKRYRVAGDATNMLVSAAYLTAQEIKLDPLLILAVMAIESGLNPFAESAVGAQGLMQVMSQVHREKFQELGGVKAALNPVANIKVGSLILKDYVTRGGSLEAGLKLYVGAAAFDTDYGYGSKVLAEYRRLKDVATGKNVPTLSTPTTSPVVQKPRQLEHANERKPEATDAESASADQRELSKLKINQVAAL